MATRARRIAVERRGLLVALAVSLGISLVTLRTLWNNGYLLQVDVVFGPHAAPLTWDFSTPVQLVLAGLTAVGGGDLAGKAYALATLFFCAFAPMFLFRRAPWYAQVAAGLLGALNPWTYDRVIEGQWGVAVAGAGLFLWLEFFEALQGSPRARSAIGLAVTSVVLTSFDAHISGPIALLTVLGLLSQRRNPISNRLRWTAAAIGVWLAALAIGGIAFFVGHGGQNYDVALSAGRIDFETFRSFADSRVGLLVSLLGLHGYWGEGVHRFVGPAGNSGWWPLTSAVLLGLTLAGAALAARTRRWLLVAGLVGVAVSASTALPHGIDAATWIQARFPLLAAYREPGKWNALWLLAVVVLGTTAIERSRGLVDAQSRTLAAALPAALASIMALATLAPTGMTAITELPAVVTPVRYPSAWYQANDYLRSHAGGEPLVAILPAHRYETLPFTGRLVTNPAEVFFDGRLLLPQDPELSARQEDIDLGGDGSLGTGGGSRPGGVPPGDTTQPPYHEGSPFPQKSQPPYHQGSPLPQQSVAPYQQASPLPHASVAPYQEGSPRNGAGTISPSFGFVLAASTCGLSNGLHAMGVHWAVVEEVADRSPTLAALISCGWRMVFGGPGSIAVLNG